MKKKLIAAIAVALVVAAAPLAQAKATVIATPTAHISQRHGVVAFRFANLPTKNGVYVEECMAPATAGAKPTVCNADQSAQAWVSNVKSDLAQGATSGKRRIKVKPALYFKGGDCLHTTCVFFITNDHNAASDRSQDQTIPFTFSAK